MRDPYYPGPQFRRSTAYGRRRDPITGEEGIFHSGQDFRADAGTPIPAATSGVVVYSGFNKNLGHSVNSLCGHMQDGARVQIGQQIWPEDIVGNVGSTGARTTGNHLHYFVINKDAVIKQKNPGGGTIGVLLNKENTIDPWTYLAVPCLDQTLRRDRMLFRPDAGGDAQVHGTGGNPVVPAMPFAPSDANKSPTPVFDTGARAVPFISDDSEGLFADRFGDQPPIRRLSSPFDRR
jgi:murein DD-endopeptidase MepM/ murein hydrolase activator NlpD